MKTLLSWWLGSILGFLGALLGAVLGGLVGNQIEAWLPGIARQIIRWQARSMGAAAARFEEQWIADVNDTPGGLAKLSVALGTLFVSLRTRVERYRHEPGGFKRALALGLWDRASWLVAAVGATIVFFYPIEPSRYAAYAFLFPLFLLAVLFLVPSFRRACRLRYERLAYSWRVGIGGLAVPVVVYFAIAFGLIPPSFQPPPRSVVVPEGPKMPGRVFFASIPREVNGSDTKAGNEAPDKPGLTVKLQNDEGRLAKETPATNPAPEASSMIPSKRAWPELHLSELPPIPLSEQPFPSVQDFVASGPPSAPTGLRILSQ